MTAPVKDCENCQCANCDYTCVDTPCAAMFCGGTVTSCNYLAEMEDADGSEKTE